MKIASFRGEYHFLSKIACLMMVRTGCTTLNPHSNKLPITFGEEQGYALPSSWNLRKNIKLPKTKTIPVEKRAEVVIALEKETASESKEALGLIDSIYILGSLNIGGEEWRGVKVDNDLVITTNNYSYIHFLIGQKIFEQLDSSTIEKWVNLNNKEFKYSKKHVNGISMNDRLESDPKLYESGFLNKCSTVSPKYDFAWFYGNLKANSKELFDLANKHPKIKTKLNDVMSIIKERL